VAGDERVTKTRVNPNTRATSYKLNPHDKKRMLGAFIAYCRSKNGGKSTSTWPEGTWNELAAQLGRQP
jgi:hypothetical protein